MSAAETRGRDADVVLLKLALLAGDRSAQTIDRETFARWLVRGEDPARIERRVMIVADVPDREQLVERVARVIETSQGSALAASLAPRWALFLGLGEEESRCAPATS